MQSSTSSARSVSTHDARRLDRLELQRRLGDDAGEAHAARRRPEHVVVVGIDGERAARGRGDASCARRSRRTSRAGTCRGCRRRSRRRPSRSACRARPSGTSRAGRSTRMQRLDAHAALDGARCPSSTSSSRTRSRLRAATRRRRPRSARRRRSCGRGRARSTPRAAGARDARDDVLEVAGLGARVARVGAVRPQPGEQLLATTVGPRQPTVHRDREEHHPHAPDHEQHAVGEHELFGRAAVALVEQQRVAEDAEHERHDRQLEPHLVRRPPPTSRTPTGSTRGSRRSTRPRARSSGSSRCTPRASGGG